MSLRSKGCHRNLVPLTRLNTSQYNMRFVRIAGVISLLQGVIVLSVFVVDSITQEKAIDVLDGDRIPLYQKLIQSMV